MRILIPFLFAVTTACTANAPDASVDAAPFVFRNEAHLDLQLRVVDDATGAPLAGAIIHLRTAVDDPVSGVLWKGMTDSEGSLAADLDLRDDQTRFVVTVSLEGYSGAYDDEKARTAYGAFAPAAWFEIDRSALAGREIRLRRSTP